jgi:hypothetical protein
MEDGAQDSFGEIILNTVLRNLMFDMCFSTGVEDGGGKLGIYPFPSTILKRKLK